MERDLELNWIGLDDLCVCVCLRFECARERAHLLIHSLRSSHNIKATKLMNQICIFYMVVTNQFRFDAHLRMRVINFSKGYGPNG